MANTSIANCLLPLPVTASRSSMLSPPQAAQFDLSESGPGGELDNITVGPAAVTASTERLTPTLLRDRMLGEDVGDGWVMHTCPDRNSRYYYHRDLRLVTTENMTNHETRSSFLSTYREEAEKNCPLETVVYENKAHVVNHIRETWDGHKSRSNYWIYLSNYPCHHDLPDHAEKEALAMLLMIVRNLTKPKGMAHTPFSMPDIQRYIDFLNLSKTLEAADGDVPTAKCMVISNIIANFYESQVQISRPTQHGSTSWLKIIVTFACWGMPPNYLHRFDTAYNMYGQTLQPDAWKSFLDVVRRERAAANVLSGLLLASSVAFLAIQNLVDFAQFFIIMSIGLSLGCVIMGFNGGLDEKLYTLQDIDPPIPSKRLDKRLTAIGRAMEQHYTMLLLSVLCFYLALLGFTAYSVYASVFVTKSFTTRYAFYVMATSGLLITMGFILRWNRQFLQS